MDKKLLVLAALLAAIAIPVMAATSDTTSVTTSVSNRPPVVYGLSAISAQNPTESSTTDVIFYCYVNDPDGNSDLSSANVTMNKTGEISRPGTCGSPTVINATALNYTCNSFMQFYDGAGTWTDTCQAYDSQGETSTKSGTFTYNTLTAWTMNVHSLSFGTIYLGVSKSADNDPEVLTNTGNADLSGSVKVTALDLIGVSNPAQYIPAHNFTINATADFAGNAMINDTAVTLTGSSLPKGAASTDSLYFWVAVPSSGLSYQTYSTAALGVWTVSTT